MNDSMIMVEVDVNRKGEIVIVSILMMIAYH
jgi:hypothetical protein